MKQYICMALALLMMATLFVGCGCTNRNVSDNPSGIITDPTGTTNPMPTMTTPPDPTTHPTYETTIPTTGMTIPDDFPMDPDSSVATDDIGDAGSIATEGSAPGSRMPRRKR